MNHGSEQPPPHLDAFFAMCRAALASCGWAGKFSLVNVLAECEDYGEFERSAALAAWHGDIGAAVDALDRGATYIRGLLTGDRRRDISQYEKAIFSVQYADLLELVSVCVAGFRAGELESSASSVWRRSCSNLMQRVGAAGKPHVSSSRIAYIRGLLRFLVCLGSKTGYQEVLGDETLSLVDRVAFACRFLPREDLVQFIDSSAVACRSSGNCEGLIVTGVDKEGIRILQAFVDWSTDVQSAALITSRLILPPDWSLERAVCLEWLDSYRSLLNTWQMWQSRAMFDVDRADLLRKVKARRIAAAYSAPVPPTSLSAVSKSSGSVSLSSRSRTGLGSRLKSSASRQADPDVMASIPAQIDARCNYCSAPLGLKNQDTHSSQLLSKMKPVLSCCPQCRKPLPRCAICLLPLGTLNPYMELLSSKDNASRQIASGIVASPTHAAPGGYSTDLSTLASLPLAEWFSWCMRCKHGGHAHHWVGWFAKHEVCPVSGCNCRCQFDGIKTLKRGVFAPVASASPVHPSQESVVES
jgi:WD repeat-containing protein mio